jgi:flagellar motor switch protein FliG
VELNGKQKAAMLLMSLDALTAAELLKGMNPEMVQELAVELASLEASGLCENKEKIKVAREFCTSLEKSSSQGLNIGHFLNEILVSLLGKDKAEQIRNQIKKMTVKKDFFADIRSSTTDELVSALEGEHPRTIAVVLSELPPKKSQEVLSLLSEETSLKVVWNMTNPDLLTGGVKRRMASMVSERLKSLKGETFVAKPGRREENLRKLAITLSGLEKDLRDQLLGELSKHDEETSTMVKRLMITWDIPSIADRTLQESLRSVESKKLAVALFGADEEVAQKIRSNISERAVAALDEEASLMQEPLAKEVLDAREEIMKPLRDANEQGTLRMTGR